MRATNFKTEFDVQLALTSQFDRIFPGEVDTRQSQNYRNVCGHQADEAYGIVVVSTYCDESGQGHRIMGFLADQVHDAIRVLEGIGAFKPGQEEIQAVEKALETAGVWFESLY